MNRTAYAVWRISAAIEYLETHLPEKVSLEEVAGAAFCSKYHFHRLFTASMGITVHDYLQRRRLTEAARALVHTETPILHIALAAGYESQQSFATVFKTMYKAPPGRFRQAASFYPLQLPADLADGHPPLIPAGGGAHWGRAVRLAVPADIPAWMRLVRQAVDGFPCLDEGEYADTLRERIARERAYILTDGDLAAGAMIISRDAGAIEFLAVHPFCRRTGVMEAMLDRILSELPGNRREIGITTYREGDRADTGHRRTLKKLGFVEAEFLTEFGYPTQKFILARTRRQRKRKR